MKDRPLLILMRHGQSIWNAKNLFTGWVDIPLTQKGIEEAISGGKKIHDIPIDVIFTSTLIRAHMTLFLALLSHKSKKIPYFVHTEQKEKNWSKIYNPSTQKEMIPIYSSWRLNERMYGKLQGLNKEATRKKYGKEQVKLWRRSYSTKPPGGESLEDTAKRALPYFQQKMVPFLKKRKNIFVSAHGNSLRAILMKIEGLSKEEILELEIPTGEPIIYGYERGKYVRQNGNFF